MKRVCGTCTLQIDSRTGNNGIEILCAYDNHWRRDNTSGCEKWIEFSKRLSMNERLELAKQIKNQEIGEKRHEEIMKSSEINRKTQIMLVILAFLLGIVGTLLSQYIWSLWTK